jgi:hypothetical protein
MKLGFRPVAYSTIAVLVAVAVFGGDTPADASIVEPVARRVESGTTTSAGTTSGVALTAVRKRRGQPLPAHLFTLDRPELPLAPTTQPNAPVAPAVSDIKVLGWMQSEDGPFVFVEWNNESYTLKPGEPVEEAYRFDRIEAGFADFTYLPTGESRRYTVRDPALLE